MKEKIIEEIEKMKGSLLGIGINDEIILNKIEDNDKINLCYILSNGGKEKNKKFKLLKKGRNKKVNIKKLKKYFRKKSIDNIICDYNVIKRFTRSFIGGSIYINKEKLYIYGSINDLNQLKEKYEKYTKMIELIKNNKSFLLIINNQKAKSNIFKDGIYKIIYILSDGLEYLTDLLIN